MALTLRAASGGQLAATTPTSQVVTLPAGTATNDIVYFIITIGPASGTVSAPIAPIGWTITLTSNATAVESTIVGYRTIQAGDTSPTISWTTAGKVSWVALALQPAAGTVAQHVGFGTVLNTGTTLTSRTPNTYAAGAASGASVILTGSRGSGNVATGVTTVQPTSWLEPTNGDQTTAVGTTSALRQVAAHVSYRLAQTGTITPGAQTNTPTAYAIVHHAFAVETPLPVMTRFAATQTSSSATTVVLTVPTGGIPLGALVAVSLAAWGENVSASFVATDSKSNVYTKHINLSQSTIGSAQHWSTVLTAALVAGDTITVTYSPSTMQDFVLTADWCTGYTNVGAQVTAATTGTGTTPSASLTPPGGATASLIYGGMVVFDSALHVAITEDTDTAGGDTWHTLPSATSPTAGRRVQHAGAYTVPTTPATAQTYNPTLGTAAIWAAYVVRYPAPVAVGPALASATPVVNGLIAANTTANTTATASITPAVGDVLVVITGASSADAIANSAAGGGYTWTRRATNTGAVAGSPAALFTTTATSTSSFTVTVNMTNSNVSSQRRYGVVVLRYSGGQLAASPVASAGNTESASGGALTKTLTTSVDNSAVAFGIVDWNGTTGTVTYVAGATAAVTPMQASGEVSLYPATLATTTAGSKTYGMIAPTGQAPSFVAIEIIPPTGVAFDAVGPSAAGTGSTASTTLSWSHTCGSGSNRALLVGVTLGGAVIADANSPVTATYGGVPLTSIARVLSNNSPGFSYSGYVQLLGLLAPASGTGTIVVTAGSPPTSLTGGSVSFTGVGSFGTVATAFGFSTAASVVVPSSNTGDMIVDALCTGAALSSSGKTSRWLNNFSAATSAGNGAQSTAAGGGAVTMSYTVSVSDWWGHIALPLIAGPGAAAALPQPVTNINQTALNRAAYF